jgi:transcriptional regulator with XRE-family HTH domain
MLRFMSTPLETQPELDSDAVAQRLRMYMGDVKLSRSQLALASGINRTSLADRLDGHVDFTLGDISAIAQAIGRSWLWVLTGGEGDPLPPSKRGARGGDPDGASGIRGKRRRRTHYSVGCGNPGYQPARAA